MTRSESLWQWTKCVSRNLPELTGSQVRLLAWWSYGIALTGSCGRSTVATFLGLLCEEKVPGDWTVIVLADRGLSSSGLYQQIKRLQWHPFLRINSTAKFQPQGKQHHWYWLLDLLHPAGRKPRQQWQQWQGHGRCFKEKGSSIDCTLLAWWGEQYEEPWFILTDLSPAACAATWYGLRSWCEQGFKCNKRGAIDLLPGTVS